MGQPETQVFTDNQINAATRDFVERVCPAALTANNEHVQWETYREIIRQNLTNP